MSRRNRVLVTDPTVSTLRDQLTATFVMEVAAGGVLGISLTLVMRAGPGRIRLLDIPPAVRVRRNESTIRLSHASSVAWNPD